MEAKIAADVPAHGSGSQKRAQGFENLGLIVAYAQYDAADIGEGIGVEHAAVGRAQPQSERTSAGFQELAQG
jgi:hypothetical protein